MQKQSTSCRSRARAQHLLSNQVRLVDDNVDKWPRGVPVPQLLREAGEAQPLGRAKHKHRARRSSEGLLERELFGGAIRAARAEVEGALRRIRAGVELGALVLVLYQAHQSKTTKNCIARNYRQQLPGSDYTTARRLCMAQRAHARVQCSRGFCHSRSETCR